MGRTVFDTMEMIANAEAEVSSSPLHLRGKRVAMVVFSTYPADTRVRRVAEALHKEGMSLDLICLQHDGAAAHETSDGIDILRLPIVHRRSSKFIYAYNYSAFILIAAFVMALRSLRHRYDLVYVHNMPDVLVLTALVPKMLGAKVLLDLHDPMPELMRTIFNLDKGSLGVRIIERLEKWSLARAHQVLTVNVACKRIFSSRSCPSDKIGVVMNTPDEGIFPGRTPCSYRSSAEIPAEHFVVMYHGSVVERNGLDLAIEAFARVRKSVPTAEFRIFAYRTPFLDQMMDEARKKGLGDCVHYFGPRSLEKLVPEIEKCDLGIVPNHRNAFTEINTPVRILEYLAMGKPVVAPRTPGVQDYFDPSSILFFESGNEEDLARMIEYAAFHYSKAVESAERGQHVYQAHRWSQEKRTLLNLLDGLLYSNHLHGS